MVEHSTPQATLTEPATARPDHQLPVSGSQKGEEKKRGWVWIVVLIVLAAGGYFLYSQYQAMQAQQQARNANNRQRAVPVTMGKVSKSDMDVYVEALGTVTPIYTVTITSRVQGQIVNIYYKEGQAV